MNQTFAMQPTCRAHALEQFYSSLFQHTGADAPLDIGTAALFQHNRLDSRQM